MAVIIRRRKQVRCKLKEAFKRPLLPAVRPRHNIYVRFALNTRRAGMFTTTVLYVTPLASTHSALQGYWTMRSPGGMDPSLEGPRGR